MGVRRAAVPSDYGETLDVRDVAKPGLDSEGVISELVSLEDTSDKLQATTDYETVGIPVIDEF